MPGPALPLTLAAAALTLVAVTVAAGPTGHPSGAAAAVTAPAAPASAAPLHDPSRPAGGLDLGPAGRQRAPAARAAPGGPQVPPQSLGRNWRWPLAPTPRVLRPFAVGPFRWSPGHRGVDLGPTAGRAAAPVLAPAPGTVRFAGVVAGRGVVSIDHGPRLRSTYEPVVPVVRAGELVSAGALIGTLGSRQAGGPALDSHCEGTPCLHWGALLEGRYVDPLTLLRPAGPPVLLPVLTSRFTRRASHDVRHRSILGRRPDPSRRPPGGGIVSPIDQPRYVHGHAEAVLRSHSARTVANSAAYLVPHLVPGVSVLDVGCGPGTITADLATRVSPGRVVGVDPAPSAVHAARQAVAGTDAEIRVADISTLSAADLDGRFDVVHAHQVLQHLADPVGALRRMRDLCVPGGVVAARDADYAAFAWFPRVPALDEWLVLYRNLARTSGGDPDAGRQVLSWALAAGFSEVTPSASVWCFASPPERQWWGGMWADRIVGSAIAQTALVRGAATRADLDRIRAGWLEWAAANDGWFLVPHGEVICRP